MKRLTICCVFLSFLLLAACEEKGPAETAGEQIDEAMERMADEFDEASDNVRNAAEQALEDGEEAIEELQQDLDEAADKLKNSQ